MEAQSRKQQPPAGLSHAPDKPHRVIDHLSLEQKARVAEAKAKMEGGSSEKPAKRYDSLTYRKAQFALLYGWEALEAVNNNEMTMNTFLDLLEAGLDVQEQNAVRHAHDMAMAYAASQDAKAAENFNRKMKRRLDNATPDFSSEMED